MKEALSVGVGDIETDPFAPGRLEINPFVAGYFDGKRKQIWWGPDCIEKMVAAFKKARGIIYFHNGGNFDFHFLLEFLPVADCEWLCMGKRIVRIKLPWGLELRDSFAIIPKKLAAYDKQEIDYKKFEANVREKHRDEIVSYLKSDLENLFNMVGGFLARFPAEVTLASSVFKLMKKEYDYNPGRSSREFDEKFRPFFFGGRVQFFELGAIQGRYHVVDINSAYPHSMTKPHWFGFSGEACVGMPKRYREQSLYVVDCLAQGCFPERQKTGGVEFPHKRGRFNVTGWELIAAKELGLVEDLKILVCYTPTQVLDIGKFAKTLYGKKLAAKKAGDKEEEFFNKIAVNAGYGKLALNPTRFSEVRVMPLFEEPEYVNEKGRPIKRAKAEKEGQTLWENCWDDKDRGLSFWKRSSYKEGIDKFVNVATAASITGYVRSFLMRSMAVTGGAVYCDTDSLVLKSVKGLKLSDRLGDWKLELTVDSGKKGTDDKGKVKQSGLWLAGKKLYAAFGQEPGGKWKWKIASKGVKLTPERIISIALGNTETMTFDAPTFSLFSRPKFVTREVNRADKRKKK